MRLFTGIALPEPVIASLSVLLDRLRPLARIQWCNPSNLHITTKFIGEYHEDRLDTLKSALSNVPANGPIEIGISGFGWYPNPHSPRVFWCGVHAPQALTELASQIDSILEPLGIEREKRAYSPHLTLARIKTPDKQLVEVKRAVANLPSTDFGSFTAGSFHLYQSKTHPSGSIYTKLADFSLIA